MHIRRELKRKYSSAYMWPVVQAKCITFFSLIFRCERRRGCLDVFEQCDLHTADLQLQDVARAIP